MIVREGIPFIALPLAGAAILAGALATFGLSSLVWVGVAILVLLGLFSAFFFRDPARTIPDDENVIVSAADGRVTRVERSDGESFVSVFLSPLDVHVNRSPIAGTITGIDYVAGKKSPATSDRASLINERNSLVIKGERISVTCTQIAGIVARRIVCWPNVGDRLERGERFGLIRFGSRTDLSMPGNVSILVEVGDRVVGGETIIARIES